MQINNNAELGVMRDHELAQIKAAVLAGILSFYCTHHKLKGAVDGATTVLAKHSKPIINNKSVMDALMDTLMTIHTHMDPRNPNGSGPLRAKLVDMAGSDEEAEEGESW